MSEIDMSQQPIVDLSEKTELLSRRQRFFKLMKTSKFWKNIIGKIFVYTVLTDFALVFILPILYMVVTGIESPIDFADENVVWIPKRAFYTDNIRSGFYALDYWNTIWYTVKIVGLCTLGHIFSGALVGYALGRLKFTGRGFIFALVLLTLIVPAQALSTSTYRIFITTEFLGMKNWPEIYRIVVPCFLGCGLNGGIFIFVFRQVYGRLPKELEEAAMIDGCDIFQTFRRIMLPLTSSAVLVCVILSVVCIGIDLFEPIMYIKSLNPNKPTLMSVRMYYTFMNGSSIFATFFVNSDGKLSSTEYKGQQPMMWCTFLSLAPILIMYMLVQKYFMASVASTGIKG